MFFRGVYFLLLATLQLVFTPVIIISGLFLKKYRRSIPARFFLIKNPRLKSDGIWFHSCSFGEAKSIQPIVEMFDRSLIRLTTTTETGFNQIKSYSEESRFLPFETFLPFWIRKQKVLVVLEAELWYMLFWVAKSKGSFTALLNSRISTKSYPKYLRFKWLYKKIFANIDKIYAQSLDDKERLLSLGAKNVEVIGNIKLLSLPKVTKEYRKPKGLIVVAGSTHKKEEELILKSFLELKREERDSKLILAPRHPDRFDEVEKLIKKFMKNWENLNFCKVSRCKDENRLLNNDVVLVDVLGELINFYKVSDIVILGGAFEPIGGHNFAEVAQFGVKIITGKYVFNQIDILNSVQGVTLIEKEELSKTLKNYKLLPNSNLKTTNIDIDKFIKDIKNVL